MNENRQSSIDNRKTAPKRKRLSSKQIAFFKEVFIARFPVVLNGFAVDFVA